MPMVYVNRDDQRDVHPEFGEHGTYLMMNVVVGRIIRGHELKWIPWQLVAAVVVDRLEG